MSLTVSFDFSNTPLDLCHSSVHFFTAHILITCLHCHSNVCNKMVKHHFIVARVDHARVDHARVDHARVDHARVDHAE